MAGWGPERRAHPLLLHSSSSVIPLLLRSPRRRAGWWVIWCIHDRSGLTSSSHFLWSPCDPAAEGEGAASFGLRSPRHVHICPLTLRHIYTCNHRMQTLCRPFSYFTGSFSSCLSQADTPKFPFPLSVSLYITFSNTLSISLSINKSFLSSSSRLNQPLCKHGC